MKGSMVAYHLLNALSHSKNLNTNVQISALGDQDAYTPYPSSLFLGYMGKYLDFKGKTVIDIGCGTGNLCITLAKAGARKVVGVDIDPERIATACKKAVVEGVEASVTFECVNFVDSYHGPDGFDIAYSQNAFEHILSPLSCLQRIYSCLAPGGVLGTMFGPLWLSPYGAHMWEFTPVPWVHLLFPEKVVLEVRTEKFRPDELVVRYEDIRGHLNRMTVKKFKQYAAQAGFGLQAVRLNPPQDRGKYRLVNAVINKLSLLQEFGAYQLLAVLKKPG